MPYIKQKHRKKLLLEEMMYTTGRECIDFELINNPGELQYVMSIIFKSYIERKGLNYQNCNDVMGALAGAQMEFYRRVVVPYEDSKIKENGDV